MERIFVFLRSPGAATSVLLGSNSTRFNFSELSII